VSKAQNYYKLKSQLLRAHHGLLKTNYQESKYEQDFMKMFKLQLDLQRNDFEKLEFKYQLRFLCYFFFNYVDKILVMYYFKNFWSDVKMYQEFENIPPK
jgi:intracellular septation protein A